MLLYIVVLALGQKQPQSKMKAAALPGTAMACVALRVGLHLPTLLSNTSACKLACFMPEPLAMARAQEERQARIPKHPAMAKQMAALPFWSCRHAAAAAAAAAAPLFLVP